MARSWLASRLGDTLFPMLAAIGYWTSIVGKVHNGQQSFLCSDHNRPDVFTHIGTQCKPCGNYWGDEYVVKDVGDVTTRLETINGSDWSAYSHGQFANRTTAFMRAAVRAKRPFFAHIGTTGPHLPAIPAPWHLEEVSRWTIGAPRAPSFNFDAPSHHPTIAAAPRIDDEARRVFSPDWHASERAASPCCAPSSPEQQPAKATLLP